VQAPVLQSRIAGRKPRNFGSFEKKRRNMRVPLVLALILVVIRRNVSTSVAKETVRTIVTTILEELLFQKAKKKKEKMGRRIRIRRTTFPASKIRT